MTDTPSRYIVLGDTEFGTVPQVWDTVAKQTVETFYFGDKWRDAASRCERLNAQYATTQARNAHGEVTPIDQAREARSAKEVATSPALDPRNPDHSRASPFDYHNCWRCKSGADPSRCPHPDNPRQCDTLHARDD